MYVYVVITGGLQNRYNVRHEENDLLLMKLQYTELSRIL